MTRMPLMPIDARLSASADPAPPGSQPTVRPVASPTSRVPAVDIWSRAEPKYRVRAVALLVFNFALYCGLCVFTHWLHVARTVDFTWDSYVGPARVWGVQTQNLNDFVLYPINVQNTPIHAVVLGLLVASIVAVPIVIAILYRFWFALPFVGAVLVFAHLPWMAVTLLLSCILAAARPFRMNFRFGSGLVGLIPVLVYLYFATRPTPEQANLIASPAQRSLLIAPWVLAIVASSGMMGLVLLISRIVDYRPGAVAPVVAVMFATPVVLFYSAVGADELAYRIIEAEYGPRSSRFEPVRDAGDEIHDLVRTGQTPALERLLLDLWGKGVDPLKRQIRDRVVLRLLADRARAYEACKFFLADYPNSRYVPNVLFVQARALDTRLDERKLHQSRPVRELYFDYPHVQSEAVWSALLQDRRETPLRVAAAVRLAQLSLRRGQTARALQCLDQALGSREAVPSQPVQAFLHAATGDLGFDFDAESYRREAAFLRELIVENHNDPRFGAVPLVLLAALDPHRPAYRSQLLALAEHYAGGLLHDNLLVLWADTISDPALRAARLRSLLARLGRSPGTPDARAQLLFRIAETELRPAGAAEDAALRASGLARLRELIEKYPQSWWAELARERLVQFTPAATKPAVQP